MKLASLIEKIGFSRHLSKDVEDVTADKFEDFGVTVGQLYQTFLKKDLSADPAIAQKIMNMVDTDDNNILASQIKDLEFLVNQLPDKAGPKDKIGFKEDDRSEKDKMFDLAQQLSKLTKDDKIKLKKIQQMIAKEKSEEIINGFNVPSVNEEKINGFDYHYTKGTSGGTQQFGRPRMVAEAEDRSFSTSNINIPGTAKSDWDPFLRSVLFPKEKEKKYTRYLQRIDWSKKTDKEIRDIGGDAYYGDDTQKEPVKGRMRILVPPEKGWPMMRLDSKGDPTGQYVFPGEKNHPVKDPKNPPKEMSWISKELRGHMTEMTDDEFEKAKELDRLEKHPEKDKIKKVQQLIRKQIKELWLKK